MKPTLLLLVVAAGALPSPLGGRGPALAAAFSPPSPRRRPPPSGATSSPHSSSRPSSAAPSASAAASSPSPPSPSASALRAAKEATFGMGCFWEPAESLLKKPGVLATAVGYAGAPPDRPPPTYDAVCFGNEWVEAVRVVYDDETTTYEELLDGFFECQKPGYSRQYASIIFASDSDEEDAAERWKEANLGENGAYATVEIEPASKFHRAEEYHQRYWEKQRIRFVVAALLIAGESGAYDDLFGGGEERRGRGDVVRRPVRSGVPGGRGVDLVGAAGGAGRAGAGSGGIGGRDDDRRWG
ncbi:hypothetical protein ACHAWF_011643 [Thalassiosira exigua]